MTSLYNLKSIPGGYLICKFDEDLNPIDSYTMPIVDGIQNCSCPAMARATCRHRTMLPAFTKLDRVDTGWFLDYDKGSWRQYVVPSEEPSQEFIDALAKVPANEPDCSFLEGEGPVPSTLAATHGLSSPSVSHRGGPSPAFKRRV